jgi:SAM-dependent methyltransferase
VAASVDVPEISDAIVEHDPETLLRLPVRKADVLARFAGNAQARRVVASIPASEDGILDPVAVDRLLVGVHIEMQRLSEEFQHGQRVAELLRPVLEAIRARGVAGPLRVVDVGCGTGYVIRWLAARGQLGPDVELIGADFNAALVAEATRLAELEKLNARFVRADAFKLAEAATVVISTGVLHHFRGAGLESLFRRIEQCGAQASVHFDFQPSAIAPLGAWVFHLLRFREPLGLHDGVLSAKRSYSGPELLAASRRGGSGLAWGLYATRIGVFPRVFTTLVGLRRELVDDFRRGLGARASRLGELA